MVGTALDAHFAICDHRRVKHLLALALFCACSSKAPAPVEKPVEKPVEPAPVPSPEPAPTGPVTRGDITSPPFKAADLKAAMPVGTEIRYRITQTGKPPVIEQWRVTAADDKGCTIHTIVFANDGTTQIEDKGPATTAWADLEKHGEFPATYTSTREATIVVAAGRFETWFFEVRPSEKGQPTRRMHFARTIAGPPVWMEISNEGVVALHLELVSRK